MIHQAHDMRSGTAPPPSSSTPRSSWRDSVLELSPSPAAYGPAATVPVVAIPQTPQTPPPSPRPRTSRALIVAHCLDLIGLLLLAAVAGVLRFGELYLIRPKLQGIDGICLSLTYRSPRRRPAIELPDYAVYILVILAPLVLLPLLEVVLAFAARPHRAKSPWTVIFFKRLAKLTLLLLLGLCITSTVADVLRLLISRPRPYFLANDDFGYGYARFCNSGTFEDPTISSQERNARLSLPSHRCTMLAFSGVMVALHAERVLRRVSTGGMYVARSLVVLVSAAPALLVAAQAYDSRSNHWEDVVLGLLLGAAMATYVAGVLGRDLVKDKQMQHESTDPPATARATPEAINRVHSFYAWKDGHMRHTSNDAFF